MKLIFFLLIFVNFSYAQFQTVKIGQIDKHYNHLITHDKLYAIIKEIEALFESQLGFNVFDYDPNGKPIDIKYIPSSKKKKQILQTKKQSKSLQKKINQLQLYISSNQTHIKLEKEKLQSQYNKFNYSVKQFNQSISKLKHSSKQISKIEFNKIKREISQKEKIIKRKKSDLNLKKKQFNRKLSTYKRKIRKYNLLVHRYNKSQRKIENLSKNLKEIKGITRSKTKTIYTTYAQDNEVSIEKSSEKYMEKIDIYDFENLQLLKVILAHEIGHLIGVEHINIKGALMNPYIQEEQRLKLSLTEADIKEFHKAFKD